MTKAKWTDAQSAQVRRIRQLQAVLGHDSDVAFALDLKISQSRLSNILRGAPIGKEVAFRLVRKVPGLTTDWIWFGNPAGLPVRLAQLLEAASDAPRKAMTGS